MLPSLIKELQDAKNSKKAEILQRFFKTGVGEYGEGDKFLGITVPTQRSIAKKYLGLNLNQIQKLLDSVVHEYRLVGILILVEKLKKSDEKTRGDIFNFYLKNTNRVNNWDLVDLSAPNIVGDFLVDKNKEVIYRLAESSSLWERRIAMISCYSFIKKEKYSDTLRVAEILINDTHDLIHKSVGWMLREIGKRDRDVEENFLRRHYKNMPRTMLRYAIEKFSDKLKKDFLKGRV